MGLLRDVQVNGDLTLAIPLYHDFPATETMVSSVLRMGDRLRHGVGRLCSKRGTTLTQLRDTRRGRNYSCV